MIKILNSAWSYNEPTDTYTAFISEIYDRKNPWNMPLPEKMHPYRDDDNDILYWETHMFVQDQKVRLLIYND